MQGTDSVDNPITKRTLKSYASRVFQESSAGIVSSAAQITNTKRKIFKFVLLIVCLSGFLYQSGKYLSVFFQYPTAIKIEVSRPDTYIIPAYTFCDNNRVNRRIFCENFPQLCEEPSKDVCDKYPSYCGENRTLKPRKEYYQKYNTLRAQEIVGLNKLDADFLKDEQTEGLLNETIAGPYFRIKDWEQVNLCYSLNDRVNNSLLPLAATNLNIMKIPVDELTFKIKVDEMFLPGNRPGILFAVHSPFEAVNPFETGVFMRPGRTYMIYVSTDEIILEKSPYDTDCVNHTELWEKNGRSGPRSQEMCKHNCGAEISLLCYGCIMPMFIYSRKEKYCELEPSVFRNKNCPADTSELEEYCYKTCKSDCRQTNFHFTVQERFKGYYVKIVWLKRFQRIKYYGLHFNHLLQAHTGDTKGNLKEDIEDLIKVEIYLDSDDVIVYKHSPKYMNIEVFSVIGGFIGIWLGMSLLDIFDIFEGIFRISVFSFKKKREFKETAIATQ